MRTLISAAAAALLLAGAAAPASAQSRLDASQKPAATPTTAAAFVREAALSDRYEIESSRLAIARATSPEIKTFAQHMIDEHSATTATLMSALPRAGVQAPDTTAPDKMRQAMIDALQAQQGDINAFDARYRAQQIQAHQETLALHRNYAAKGDNAVLREVAAQTVPKVQHHLDMLTKMKP
jgi:putative membrane protein